MALAIRFDRLLREGLVTDYAALGRLGHVSRARVTQVMNLLGLAPDLGVLRVFLAAMVLAPFGCSWSQPAPRPAWPRPELRARHARPPQTRTSAGFFR